MQPWFKTAPDLISIDWMFRRVGNAVGFLSAAGSIVGQGRVSAKRLHVYSSVFDFEAIDIHEQNQQLSKYKGNVTLVVNVASYWGLTPLNYEQLQQINEKYYDQGLRILAFPCNQFGNQEPGTDEEIIEFVKKYGVTFDMFHKINVNGANAIPLYKWLKEKLPGTITNAIKWNFTKFLSDKNGVPYKRYAPNFAPNDIIPDIEKLLAQEPTNE